MDLLAFMQAELLLFAGVFFLLGAVDEFAVDLVWLWLKQRGGAQTPVIKRADFIDSRLEGRIAVFIPAWCEAAVIGHTLHHAKLAWPQDDVTFFVGCYYNDPETTAVAEAFCQQDARCRVVTVRRAGPTTKADCLNEIFVAMEAEERLTGKPFSGILLHDAEDLVDPAALSLIDRALQSCDFVQLPVMPLAHPESRWISAHYIEEFAEAHGKSMVVRNALGAGVPAAGVGCAFDRSVLGQIAANRSGRPFSETSLTEDYELGLSIQRLGGRSRFLRVRGDDGALVATRAYFPRTISAAVRQKSRWLHGIAFQGWDRLGWSDSPAENWMRLRDRRGPLAAIVLLAGYLLVVVTALSITLSALGISQEMELSPLLWWLVALNFAAFAWRALMRFAFCSREYGLAEGLRAVLRIPVGNIIAIMAARKATIAYVGSLAGRKAPWEKTSHDRHPSEEARHSFLSEHFAD